ncbi:MAG: glycosyltransferase family 2 protein [Bacteroidales bacterium]|jgi:glycosyltransferase involved in cell wall biosynthesis|nr:glycosyltransferase family 2 protein [Bacteroidales bacterium]
MKLISVVSPCYNEQENVEILYNRVKEQFELLKEYSYEHIFIDNNSTDNTINILKDIAKKDNRVKVIINSRNFGHIRSPYYAMLQAKGDAVISLVSDLQDPPELIPQFIQKWEEGFKIVAGVKKQSEENILFFRLRKTYYNLVTKLSDVPLIKNFTGFGLYDREVIEHLREIKDNYPYFRGLICEIGFDKALIEYSQPKRKRGITKNNFFTLYDIAMLGITSHSKLPLRLATMAGFITAFLSLIAAIVYLIIKIINWYSMPMGQAPLVIGLFFFSSVQLIFIGIIGEYIGNIHTHVMNRPLVVEKERINF